MPPEVNEVDKFFDGLPKTDQRIADIFGETPVKSLDEEKKEDEPKDDPEKGTTEPEDADPDKGEHEPRKNRQHRRAENRKWEDRLTDRERDIIAREARIQERERLNSAAANGEVDPILVQMYGDNTEAITLHQKLLEKTRADAEESAYKRLQAAREEEERQRAKFESEVLEGLESIEDVYDIDLTSDAPRAKKSRSEFLGLVEKLSPKDERGNIIAYVDFDSAWNMYSAARNRETKQTQTTDRAKEIAGQSMQKGAPAATTPKAVTPGFDGWKKDFGIGY